MWSFMDIMNDSVFFRRIIRHGTIKGGKSHEWNDGSSDR